MNSYYNKPLSIELKVSDSLISLKNHHSLALEASCKNILSIDKHEQLATLSFNRDRFFILGAGTNLAFIDDFEGDVISYAGDSILLNETSDSWRLTVEAGCNWHQLVNFTIAKGIGGLENLALIPGNCGAAPVQNIGAYGVEFADVCEEVATFDVMTGEEKRFTNRECQFGYRDSIFKRPTNKSLLVTQIVVALPKKWIPKTSYKGLSQIDKPLNPKIVADKVIALRQSKLPDPEELPNAGSFFKNPVVTVAIAKRLQMAFPDMPQFVQSNSDLVKLSAGWLIEHSGLKGFRLEYLATYEQHALVIVNHGGGGGEELLRLINHIVRQVKSRFNIQLENEVILVGKEGIFDI